MHAFSLAFTHMQIHSILGQKGDYSLEDEEHVDREVTHTEHKNDDDQHLGFLPPQLHLGSGNAGCGFFGKEKSLD